MAEGFLSSTVGDATEQALIDALIVAQAALGLAPISSTPYTTVDGTVQLTDATTVDGVAWTDLKATATLSTYDDSALSEADLQLVAALIAAQSVVGLPSLISTPYTTGNSYTDSTIIASVTWADLKAIAMLPGFDDSDLSSSDRVLVANLISA